MLLNVKLGQIFRLFAKVLIHAYLHDEAELFKTIEPYEYLVAAYVKYKEYKRQLPAVLYRALTKQNGFSYNMPAELVNMISEY